MERPGKRPCRRIPTSGTGLNSAVREELACRPRGLGDPVLLEPGKQAPPTVFRRFLAIARSIICKEGVRCLWVDDNRRWAVGSPQGLPHLLNGVNRDSLVASAIQTEHRSLQTPCHVQRMR